MVLSETGLNRLHAHPSNSSEQPVLLYHRSRYRSIHTLKVASQFESQALHVFGVAIRLLSAQSMSEVDDRTGNPSGATRLFRQRRQ